MINWQRLFCFMVGLVTYAQCVFAMEFDFQPLSSLCRIEVNLATGFGTGTVRGTFSKMNGKIDFSVENPLTTRGTIYLSSRSLHFGYPKIAHDAHAPNWLDSTKYPQISFQMQNLADFSWHGKQLRANAIGILKIKDFQKVVQIPIGIEYFRAERRKYEGKTGDLIRIQGLLSLPRSQFGLATGKMLGSIMEHIEVRVFFTGVSNHIRPFLPSRLFWR